MTDSIDIKAADAANEARAKFLDTRAIIVAEVGSTSHGVSRSDLSDIDEHVIFVPPMTELCSLRNENGGLSNFSPFLRYRPGRAQHEPSKPGDIDRNYSSLKRFLELALMKGDATQLYTLFGLIRHCNEYGEMLMSVRDKFVNARTQSAYYHYVRDQTDRMQGLRGSAGRVRRSPEGGGVVDWKYAMHALRLGMQGYEYLTTGHMTSPSPDRDLLLRVRYGEMALDDVIAMIRVYQEKIGSLSLPKLDKLAAAAVLDVSNEIHWQVWQADRKERDQ